MHKKHLMFVQWFDITEQKGDFHRICFPVYIINPVLEETEATHTVKVYNACFQSYKTEVNL